MKAALSLGAVFCALVCFPDSAPAQARATYLYNLSTFSGQIREDSARVRVDRERNESYVIYQSLVRVFNPSGMEVFRFGEDLTLGQLLDLAVDPNGDIILLSYKDSRSLVTRCSFRGIPIAPIEVRNLPEGVTFGANRMVLRNGLLYFAALNASTVIVTTSDGDFRQRVDLLRGIDADKRQMEGAEINGFAVDRDGSFLFTVPVLFKVCRLTPDGKLVAFGRSGSAAGQFGVLGGVEVDGRGNVLVADKLKSVVIIFDKDFHFLAEFGYRGSKAANLIVPEDIAVDGRDRLYVSQARRRGVSVFAISQ